MFKVLKQETEKSGGQFAKPLDGVGQIEISQGDLKDNLDRLHDRQDN
jgi:hypothetical protein